MRNTIVRKRSKVNRTGAGDFAEYIAVLHRAVHALGLYLDAALEGEVTQAEAIVLLHLSTAPESTINDVHRTFLHKRSTLTSVVDRLEGKGFVQRRVGHADRRNFALQLTADGRKAAGRVVQSLLELEHVMEIAPAQLRAARRVVATSACAAYDRASAGTARRS